MSVLATLLVVGSMDDARADIIGNGNIHQSFVEELSQVGHPLLLVFHSVTKGIQVMLH